MNKRKSFLAAQENIYKSIAPFYYSLKIFGLACYSLNFDTANIKTQFFNSLLFGIFICAISFGAVESFINDFSFEIDVENKTISIGKKFYFILQIFLSIFVISWNFWNHSAIVKLLKNLAQFDQIIIKERFKYKINHVENRHKLMFWLGLSFICLLFISILTYFSQEISEKQIWQYIIVYYIIQIFTMNVFQFIFSTYAVISRFEVLIQNTKLYLSSNNNEYFWTETPIARKSQIARKITMLNDLLHDAIENINSIFSIEIVPNYLLILIGDVIVFYSLVLTYKSDAFSGKTLLIFIMNNVYQSIPITISIHFGSVVAKMSQQMAIAVGKIITSSDEKEVIERVSLFSFYNFNKTLNIKHFTVEIVFNANTKS